MGVELHCHSLFSVDGLFTPEEIAERAAAAGIAALALTDHNTLDGIGRCGRRAAEMELRFVTGVEIDAMWRGTEHHFLGFGFDPSDRVLRGLCERQFGQYAVNFERFLPVLERRYGVTREALAAGLAARYPTHPAPVLNKR
jgi:predicted metal-dependent phosphoesterase TrpH